MWFDLAGWLLGEIISLLFTSLPDRSAFGRNRVRAANAARKKARKPVEQPPPSALHRCAERLNSSARRERIEAAWLFGEMHDPAAVPILLRAIERYNDDAPFLEVVVRSLEQLGDIRSLPALHRLAAGRNYSLMAAARQAIAAIEPKTLLLRSSAAPIPTAHNLLRPAALSGLAASPEVLLRFRRHSVSPGKTLRRSAF